MTLIVSQISPYYNERIAIEKICSNNFLFQDSGISLSDATVQFLNDVSQEILLTPDIRRYPELVSLAYWLRRGNIQSIISDFRKTIGEQEMVFPRGTALHIAPLNVESIFMYSWALSLLAGNRNIIRVSQYHTEQTMILLEIVKKCLQSVHYIEIANRNIILTYPHNVDISTFLSERADIRIIWGGNETIDNVRSLPSKPTTKDIVFADKFSYCIIQAAQYLQLEEKKHREIGRLFFNDAYWFNQMACSSPRIVYFVGNISECEKASFEFWKSISEELKYRNVADTMSVSLNKLSFLYEAVIEDIDPIAKIKFEYDKPTVVRFAANEKRVPEEPCGGGFFFECFLNKLGELKSMVRSNDQTITYFGFKKEDMRNFLLSAGGKGITRIVPIGKALDFSTVWDGYVLLAELTKRVVVWV